MSGWLTSVLSSDGVYTARVCIGSPPIPFELIVDTGSFVTALPCTWCDRCGMHGVGQKYDPGGSATAGFPDCRNGTGPAPRASTHARRQHCKEFLTSYAESSEYRGVLISEVGYLARLQDGIVKAAPMKVGCITHETGILHDQRADGILGLARGAPSVALLSTSPLKTVLKGKHHHRAISLCLSDSGGRLWLGDAKNASQVDKRGAIVLPIIHTSGSQGYALRLQALRVQRIKHEPLGEQILDRASGSAGNSSSSYTTLENPAHYNHVGGTDLMQTTAIETSKEHRRHGSEIVCVIDTGSTSLRLPTPLYAALCGLLRQQLSELGSLEFGGHDPPCAYLTEEALAKLPTLTLHFVDAKQTPLILAPQQLMLHRPASHSSIIRSTVRYMRHRGAPSRRMCAALDDSGSGKAFLGAAVLRNTEVVFMDSSVAFVQDTSCGSAESSLLALNSIHSLGCPVV